MRDLDDELIGKIAARLAEIMDEELYARDKLYAATAIVVASEALIVESINAHEREFHNGLHDHPHTHHAVSGREMPVLR